jgi:HSP20 family protein
MTNLISWDPIRDFRTLQERFSRVLGTPTTPARSDEETSLGAWLPPVDIAEDKDRILLTVELPGFKQDQIQIQMEGGVLTLRGERKFEEEKNGRSYHRVERAYGHFMRSFTLPSNVDREAVKANFSDGLLQIELPKREESKPRQIQITSGGDSRKKDPIDVKSK